MPPGWMGLRMPPGWMGLQSPNLAPDSTRAESDDGATTLCTELPYEKWKGTKMDSLPNDRVHAAVSLHPETLCRKVLVRQKPCHLQLTCSQGWGRA